MRAILGNLLLIGALSAAVTVPAGRSAAAERAPAPAAPAATYPAAVVLSQIGQNAGVIVLADSTVQARLPLPAVPATRETVEQQLAEMVRALPAGTTWAKLYVPAPANGRWSAETVADYARSLARLVGTVGRAAPTGTVEILGRQVPADKANEYIAALNLKLVYLVTNSRTQGGAEIPPNWAQMSSDQRQAFADQQARRIVALNPAARMQMLREMMMQQLMQQSNDVTPQQMIIRMVWGQMSNDEQVALKQAHGADAEARGGR